LRFIARSSNYHHESHYAHPDAPSSEIFYRRGQDLRPHPWTPAPIGPKLHRISPPELLPMSTATRRALIGSSVLGPTLLTAFAAQAQGRPYTPLEQANIKVVTDFMHSVKPKDATSGAQYLAPDVVYRMTETTPPDRGHAAIVQRLAPFIDNADRIEFEILATHAMGPIVINHRIDRFVSTVRPLLFEGVGVFFLKDGKIREWTDYTIRAVLANQWPAAR
jgi:limonene-1,2-epoxide hydrolase